MSAIRKLNVNPDSCIGCQACASVCPAALISFSDDNTDRIFRFAETCAEDCRRCADACSEKAITLSPTQKASQNFFTTKLPLAPCVYCEAPFATERMVAKLRISIPALLVPDDMDWLKVCLACRQKGEARSISDQGLKRRSFS